MKKLLLFALAALLPTAALPQTRPLPEGTVKDGTVSFGTILPNFAKREGNKTIITPDTLRVLGSSSTGNISGMSVQPEGEGQAKSLSTLFRNYNIVGANGDLTVVGGGQIGKFNGSVFQPLGDGSNISVRPEGEAQAKSLSNLFKNYNIVGSNGDLTVVGGGQIGKFNGPTFQPLGDGSGLSNVATMAVIPDLSGTTNSKDAITSAIDIAKFLGKSELILPTGSIRIHNGNGSLVVPSNMTMRGAGPGKTVIICDDSGSATTPCITTAPGSVNVHLSNFTVRGLALDTHTQTNANPISFQGCTDCSLTHSEVRHSRFISVFARNSNRIKITDNLVFESMSDSINISDTPNAIISRNIVVRSNDDAISAHTYDTAAAPVRGGIIITDNNISESQGIRVLGAKQTRISGNVMRRMMSFGINVHSESFFGQGDTPIFGVDISNNVITDVFRRSEPNPRSTFATYIIVGGGPRSSASSTSGIPGWPNSSGAIVDPFGIGTGNYYANGTNAANTATPGGGWFNIHNNTLLRTLPAVTAYAQWGYGSTLHVGDNGDGSGYYSGAIPESALNIEGIIIDGALSESRITNNLIRTTGSYGVRFSPSLGGATAGAPIKDFDFDGLTIAGNKIKDVSAACVYFPATARTNQRISFIDNNCDGDPRFISGGRGTGGTWSSSTALYGIQVPFLASAGELRGNTFRNVSNPLNNGGGGILKINNIIYAHGNAGYSASNTGVGAIPGASSAWTIVDEDGDPRSATFGQLLTFPSP